MSQKTDQELIAEAVNKARQKGANPNWVDADTANECLREAFGERQQPADVVAQFMKMFCT